MLGEASEQSPVVNRGSPVPPDHPLDPPSKTILPQLLRPQSTLSLDGIAVFGDSVLDLAVELPDEAIPIEVDHTDQPVRIRVGHLKLWFRKSQTEHLRARQTLARRHGPWVGQGHHCPGLTQSRAPDDETVDLGSQVIWGAQASPQREVRGSQTGREAGCPADVHHGARCGRHRQTVEHGGPRRRTNVLADHLRGPDPDIWHEHVDSRRPVLDPRHTPEGSRGRVREHHVVRGRTLSGCGMDEGNMTSAGS